MGSSTRQRHSGDWFIFRIDEQGGLEPLSKGRFPRGEECDASPICSHGSVYFTTSGGIYCLRDPNKTPGVRPVPPQPQERPVDEDPQPACVQIVPAELLMRPGGEQTFQARLYNARGQFLRETTAQFSVSGAGTIDNEGHFRANDDAAAPGSDRDGDRRRPGRKGARANGASPALGIHV